MSFQHLSVSERETIAQMSYAGASVSVIARELGRSASTISRELRRNGDSGGYSAHKAQQRSMKRRSERRVNRKLDDRMVAGEVRRMLSCRWSPETVAGRLRHEHPGEHKWHISHQTIYRWIWKNAGDEGVSSSLRHGRYRRRGRSKREVIRNRKSIHTRPSEVEGRDRLGDWEGDTIVGRGHNGYVATFVDRRSGYLVASRMRNKRASSLNQAAERAFREVPVELRQTLTVDNGTEFAKHEQLTRRLGLPIYFADAYSSWQRGTNENTNGLLRQYIPKSTNILDVMPTALAFFVDCLNNRPRKRLGYLTPAEVFNQSGKLCN